MSFQKASFLGVAISLCFMGCERPKEPTNNLLEIRPLRIDSKSWANVPETFTFNLAMSGGGQAPEISSPSFTLLAKNAPAKPTAQFPSWQLEYPELERLAMLMGAPLKLKIYSRDMGSSDMFVFAGEMASGPLDIDYIPFSKPVIYVIQDNPSATRSFNDATGAKIVFAIQRHVKVSPSPDLPAEGTYRAISEKWWVDGLTTSYYTYKESLGLMKSLMQEVYLVDIEKNPNFLNEYDLQKNLSARGIAKFRSRIEKYVAQKSRQKLKSLMLTAARANPQEVDDSKLTLFWDYFSSESKTTFFTALASKYFLWSLQSVRSQMATSRVGNKFIEVLEREIAQDNQELEAMKLNALQALRDAKNNRPEL